MNGMLIIRNARDLAFFAVVFGGVLVLWGGLLIWDKCKNKKVKKVKDEDLDRTEKKA